MLYACKNHQSRFQNAERNDEIHYVVNINIECVSVHCTLPKHLLLGNVLKPKNYLFQCRMDDEKPSCAINIMKSSSHKKHKIREPHFSNWNECGLIAV